MANEAMKDEWNGETGQDFVRLQDRYDRMLAPWADLVAELAGIRPGERVLDVGSGCGATTLDAAARTGPDGAVLGVDLSAPMVERARERAAAAGYRHVRFAVADAQAGDVGADHDVVISRLGVMFFDDPVAAFAHLAAATRPGGRLAAVAWASALDQEWMLVPGGAAMQHVPFPDFGEPGAPGMFGLAEADRTAATLAEAGWADVAVERHQRPMLVGGPGTLDDAMAFVTTSGPGTALLDGAPDEGARARAIQAIRDALAGHVTADGVRLSGTVLALTARRP
jgi:SAM-dependent methyltransferase